MIPFFVRLSNNLKRLGKTFILVIIFCFALIPKISPFYAPLDTCLHSIPVVTAWEGDFYGATKNTAANCSEASVY